LQSEECRVSALCIPQGSEFWLSILHERVGRSIYFAFRDLKWYARPVTLRIQALI
jgi:hypothetical protein